MNSSEIIKILKEEGWVLARTKGSHHQFTKDGKTVTVPHPEKDLGVADEGNPQASWRQREMKQNATGVENGISGSYREG